MYEKYFKDSLCIFRLVFPFPFLPLSVSVRCQMSARFIYTPVESQIRRSRRSQLKHRKSVYFYMAKSTHTHTHTHTQVCSMAKLTSEITQKLKSLEHNRQSDTLYATLKKIILYIFHKKVSLLQTLRRITC